jgi:hypothetical protein
MKIEETHTLQYLLLLLLLLLLLREQMSCFLRLEM